MALMRFFGIVIISVFFLQCDKTEEPEMPDVVETILNFEVNVTSTDDGSGKVLVQASGENIASYEITSGIYMSAPITSTSGSEEIVYELTGAYDIVVLAKGTAGDMQMKEERIFVRSKDPEVIGTGPTSPFEYEDFILDWNDEFEGNLLNTEKWSYDIGTGCPDLCGWGNNELQYYREENNTVSNGVLTMEARRENFEGSEFTSAKVVTRDKHQFLFGRFDIRAKLPEGQGLWPALWLLGVNQPTVGWPSCGEIDIMEMIGGEGREKESHGNVFWEENGTRDMVGDYILQEGTFAEDFHVFSIIWDDEKITWLVDDEPFHSFGLQGQPKSAFKNPFYFLMNVAVGGTWPGNPDGTTNFPTSMEVDYVRIFRFK